VQIKFDLGGIEKILAHTESHEESFSHYGKKRGKGFWLVGDQGVYLMSNSTVVLPSADTIDSPPEQRHSFVAYGQGLSPDDENWWELKRATFGGDDGVEFIGLRTMKGAIALAKSKHRNYIELDISPTGIGIDLLRPKLPKKPRKSRKSQLQEALAT